MQTCVCSLEPWPLNKSSVPFLHFLLVGQTRFFQPLTHPLNSLVSTFRLLYVNELCSDWLRGCSSGQARLLNAE